jgi:hypothetical protein
VTPATLTTYGYHVDNFRQFPPGATVLEFGAGRNLLSSLLLSSAGAARIYAIDLERLATLEQVNAVIDQLRLIIPGQWPKLTGLGDLAPLYRIEYRAPGDARNTGLPDGSVDFICSTSTLEHIPADDILAILRECRRVASSQALFSFIIDYHDHYGTADKQIGRFHFYRYSDREWRKFNPSNHYQNRLRHSDYEKLFERSGLSSLQNKRIFPDWTGPDLKRATVSPSFKHYSHDDLVAANGHFLLSKIVSAPLA